MIELILLYRDSLDHPPTSIGGFIGGIILVIIIGYFLSNSEDK